MLLPSDPKRRLIGPPGKVRMVIGGLRILLVLRFLHNYDCSMTATIGSDTIQCSARAGTTVTGIFITLATWNTGCRWSATYNTVFHSRIMPYFIRLFPHYASSVIVPIMPKTMPAP